MFTVWTLLVQQLVNQQGGGRLKFLNTHKVWAIAVLSASQLAGVMIFFFTSWTVSCVCVVYLENWTLHLTKFKDYAKWKLPKALLLWQQGGLAQLGGFNVVADGVSDSRCPQQRSLLTWRAACSSLLLLRGQLAALSLALGFRRPPATTISMQTARRCCLLRFLIILRLISENSCKL